MDREAAQQQPAHRQELCQCASRPLDASSPLKLIQAGLQVANFLAQVGYIPPKLTHIAFRLGLCREHCRIGCQECCLALVSDHQSVACELGNSGAYHGGRCVVLPLELCQRRELSARVELTCGNSLPQPVGDLLICGLARPIDHRHSMPP